MKVSDALAKATVKVIQKAENVANEQGIEVTTLPQADGLMTSFFKLDSNASKKTIEQLNEIKEWAKSKAETEDELELVGVLKDLRFRLGAPKVGENPVDQFHRYIKLRKTAEEFANQAKAMEE